MDENPFGKWTHHRAQIAAMSRADAGTPERELAARQMLKAARLADVILRDRDSLTSAQRKSLADMLRGRP